MLVSMLRMPANMVATSASCADSNLLNASVCRNMLPVSFFIPLLFDRPPPGCVNLRTHLSHPLLLLLLHHAHDDQLACHQAFVEQFFNVTSCAAAGTREQLLKVLNNTTEAEHMVAL